MRNIGRSNLSFSGAVAIGIFILILQSGFLPSRGPVFAQSTNASMQLQAGIEKEEAAGDLNAAMAIYEKIAADASAPREVRAKALLRLAGCDEKLGRQPLPVYEHILRDYADQPVAALARKRLALIQQKERPAPPRTMTVRKIDWQALGSVGTGDTDGERAVYWSEGHLYFGDLAGHSRHLIGDFRHLGTIPSRDFAMVALNLKATLTRPHTLAVIRTDGSGYRELIRDDANHVFGMTSSFNTTWSWDDKYLEISDFDPRSNLLGQVWIVSVADGRYRVVADQSDGFVRKGVFSPDGRFLAYEAWPRDGLENQTSRIFVVPVQGGQPRLVFESAQWKPGNSVMSLLDWTANGRYIAVHDVRQGKSALYLQPIKGGAGDGEAVFIRYGEFDDGYTTAAGALVAKDDTARPNNTIAWTASIGPDGRLGGWRPLDLNTNTRTNPWPSFSPDGSQIAYLAIATDPTRRNLVVRNLATSRDREIYQSAYSSLACQYSVRNPRVFCTVEREKGESELFSVEVESGAIEHIASFAGPRYLVRCSRDDQTFYLSPNAWGPAQSDPPILEWNRSTGRETVIIEDREHYAMPSPDGRSVVGLRDGVLGIRPISGGDWMPLVSGIGINSPVYATPDGNWVVYEDQDAMGRYGIFRVPVQGGKPERLGDAPGHQYYKEWFFSPDSREVLVYGAGASDLWLLENYVPSEGK